MKKDCVINIPLAEPEFLYDPNRNFEGLIDPNIMSAGGFPIMVLNGIINHVLFERYDKFLEIEKTAERYISVFFGDSIDDVIYQTLYEYVNKFKPYIEEANVYDAYRNLFKICDLGDEFWAKHRLAMVDCFFQLLESKKGIGRYSYEFCLKVVDYLNKYIEVMNLQNFEKGEVISDYILFWESDLGYFLKYIIEKECGCTYNVWIDIHSNTGLFSLKPFLCYMSHIGMKKYEKIYKRLRKSISINDNDILITKEGVGFIKYNVFLNGVKQFEETLTKRFNQEAYTYDYFPKDKLDLNNQHHKFMYFSNMLNAKNSYFYTLLKSGNSNIQIPPTFLGIPSLRGLESLVKEGKLVMKEGSRCTTGGKNVAVYEQLEILAKSITEYACPIFQAYIPSFIFSLNGEKSHTHARKISLMYGLDECIHLGYGFKLTYAGSKNSSAYKTVYLFYDEEGNFIEGNIYNNKRIPVYFYSLEEFGIEPLLSKEEFLAFLKRVQETWTHSMKELNMYRSENIAEKANKLVDMGYIDECFRL